MSAVVAVIAFALAALSTSKLVQPLSWWLFRWCHRNNPEALAFADRNRPRRFHGEAD